MKRILSLIICLVSILTVALPVYAAEDGVNIEGVTDGEESAAEGEGPATEDDIVQEPEVLAAPVVSSVNYTDFQTVKISWSGVDGADGYYVFRKNEGEEAWRNIGDTANTSFTDAKAFDGGKFYYYVQGYRITEGEKIAGEFNIPESYIYSKLSSPSIKSLSCIGYKKIKLTWGKVTGADGYRVYRKKAGASSWSKLADVTDISYTDTKAKYETEYYYTVRAYAKSGSDRVYGSYDKKGLKVLSKMPAPKLTSAECTGFRRVKVKWNAVDGAEGYTVFRKKSGSSAWKHVGTVTGTSFTDKNAIENITYSYTVRPFVNTSSGVHRGKKSSKGISVKAEFTAPKLVSAKSVGYQTIDIKWKTVTGAKKYNIMRKEAGSKNWKTIAKNITGTTYRDKSAKLGVTYIYSVRGVTTANGKTIIGKYNTKGISAVSAFVKPTGLKASNTSYNKITVSWDSLPGVTGYKIYRKTSSSGKWKCIATTKNTKYTNKVEFGKTYYYSVCGYVSAKSTIVGEKDAKGIEKRAVTSAPKIDQAKEAACVTLKWGKMEGADGYYVYRKESGEWKKIAATYKTYYTDGDAKLDGKYTYTVRAYRLIDGEKVFGDYNTKGVTCKRVAHVHFYQGDDAWGFSCSIEKKGCVLNSFSMLLKNLGEKTNPRMTYEDNGFNSGMYFGTALKHYDREYVCAVSKSAKYYSDYDSTFGYTYIKDPAKNGVKAIKAAIDRNPEGVLCYFIKGSERHAIVAIGYEGDTIYYCDPGRVYSKGYNVTFENTWCKVGHNMSYKHLSFIMAID